MAKDNRAALIQVGTDAVRKAFKNCVTTSGSSLTFANSWASSGSLSLDRLFAGGSPGGLPMGPTGRIIHLPGDWSTGKSLLLDQWFRSVIVDLGGIAKRAETEGTADPHFANAIGLPLEYLLIDRPETIEQMFDMFMEWHDAIRRRDPEIPILYGVDSLKSTEAGKSSGQDLSKSGGWHYGGGSSEALDLALKRAANLVCARYPTTIVLLNQTRDNVGVMFGPKKTTSGGNPPHFYASLEVWLSSAPRPGHGYVRANVEQQELTEAAVKRLGLYHMDRRSAVLGRYIRATVTKTKLGPSLGQDCDFYIDFRRGVHRWEGLAEKLIVEGRLRTNPDATGEYEMLDVNGEPMGFSSANDDGLHQLGGGRIVHETKRDWMIWLSKNLWALEDPAPDAGTLTTEEVGHAQRDAAKAAQPNDQARPRRARGPVKARKARPNRRKKAQRDAVPAGAASAPAAGESGEAGDAGA